MILMNLFMISTITHVYEVAVILVVVVLMMLGLGGIGKEVLKEILQRHEVLLELGALSLVG